MKRRTAAVTGLAVVVALVALAALVVPGVAAAGGGGSHPTAAKKMHNATFGASPASTLKDGHYGADGRSMFSFDVTPGGTSVDHLAVINLTHRPERLDIYTLDAVPTTNGTVSYPAPNTKPQQAGAWMSVGTPGARGYIVAKPRSTSILPIHVRLPMNAPPGDHVGGVIVSLTGTARGNIGSSGGSVAAKFDQRIAIETEFRVTGHLAPNLTVEGLSAHYHGPIDPFAKGYVTVSFRLHNGGNAVLGGPQTITVHGLFGESVAAPHQVDVPAILPGASYGPLTVRVPNVYPETLMTAKVSVHPGGLAGQVTPYVATISGKTRLWALPIVNLVAVLIVLILLAFRVRRYRKRKAGASTVAPEDGPRRPMPAAGRHASTR